MVTDIDQLTERERRWVTDMSGLTIAQAAAIAGVSHSTVQKTVKGSLQNPAAIDVLVSAAAENMRQKW